MGRGDDNRVYLGVCEQIVERRVGLHAKRSGLLTERCLRPRVDANKPARVELTECVDMHLPNNARRTNDRVPDLNQCRPSSPCVMVVKVPVFRCPSSHGQGHSVVMIRACEAFPSP